jgi:hypothetical protein
MMFGVKMVTMCRMGVFGRLGVRAFLVLFRREAMMLRGVIMMFGRLRMVVGDVVRVRHFAILLGRHLVPGVALDGWRTHSPATCGEPCVNARQKRLAT